MLRLVPSEGDGRPHYRIAYGDPDRNFVLSKRDGTWALRLRKHLKSKEVLERQLELEARFVIPEAGKKRNRRNINLDVPAPLRLYVSVRIAPPKR